jgi:hypothetical protein
MSRREDATPAVAAVVTYDYGTHGVHHGDHRPRGELDSPDLRHSVAKRYSAIRTSPWQMSSGFSVPHTSPPR